jgi:hypothetical protein
MVNLFCFTFHNAISKWGEIFMEAHLACKFEELKVAFCKHYWKVQIDEQVHMALWVIKQGGDEKVKVYYECILILANCF